MSAPPQTAVADGVGQSAVRPDGVLKVRGEFAYSSDMWADDMLWGATLRSPHPYARIRSLDIGAALKVPGVYAVLTHSDVPGENRFGLEHADQPVLADDVVRYAGEPVAVVGADHPETARRAAARIAVDYDVRQPLTDPEAALADGAPRLHPGGNLVRAPLPPPAVAGGEVDLRTMPGGVSNTTHGEGVRRGIGYGVGGAFGAREDLSMQIHACLLALHAGKPVKIVYGREESFYGHVHRHPAVMRYEHGADRDGRLVFVRARIVLDGGAYASTTAAVTGNAGSLGIGPYQVPNAAMDCYGVYTNNPPCGAMRGFGAVQAAFGYESQMDRLADALGLDPVELRLRNAMHEGSVLPTGQRVDSAAPVAELLRRVRDAPLPPPAVAGGEVDLRTMPGGVSNTTHGEGVRRGIGYGVGIKNVGFSEGFDDYSTARVRLAAIAGEPAVEVHTAAAEVGQGLVTLQAQIARTELGVWRVSVLPADTAVGSAGSSSASRQSYMTGGAVRAACEAVRAELDRRAGRDSRTLSPAELAALLGDGAIERTVEWRHRPTSPLDPVNGQGNAHVQYAFAAHRAVVDVDTELGLVRVVELACAQDVGRALNPQAVVGQIHGGSAQGLGLAVMEEIQVLDGQIRNPSFTDYLIPTILDMPPMRVDVLELADPHAPYGLRGVGEPPTISSTPAIVAAIRAATGRPLNRIPVRPEHIVAASGQP